MTAFEGSIDGWQVAFVKMSTNFRTKKRGNVPPRLLTLWTCRVSERPMKEGVMAAYVARRVIYVPPMAGSEILAWKAEIATNMIVVVKVLYMCCTMMTRRYGFVVPDDGKNMTTSWAVTWRTIVSGRTLERGDDNLPLRSGARQTPNTRLERACTARSTCRHSNLARSQRESR